MRCPFKCENNKEVIETARILAEEKKLLAKECQRLQSFNDIWNSLCKLEQEGHHIIGVEEKESVHYVVFIDGFDKSSQDQSRVIYLHTLPFRSTGDWIAYVSLEYHACCRARIGAVETRGYNQGYGSILMKHTLSYLQYAGFRTVTGTICPADFDHKDRLHHFYEKFGFEIRQQTNSEALYLDLLKEKNLHIKKEGALVCCRDGKYPILKNEALLAQNDEQRHEDNEDPA